MFKRIPFLVLILVLLTLVSGPVSALESKDQKKVEEILRIFKNDPDKISYGTDIVVDPNYRNAIVHLTEHHTNPNVIVGGILATAMLYSGDTRKMSRRFNGKPYNVIPPDAQLKRILFKRLNSTDPWIRKKAWGLAKPFLVAPKMDPEVDAFLDKTLRDRAHTWEARYTGIYFPRPMLNVKQQKLLLHLMTTSSQWKPSVRVYYQMEKRRHHFKGMETEFKKILIRDLRGADRRHQGCALSTGVVWADSDPQFKASVLKQAKRLLSSGSPFVASRAAMAIGYLSQTLPREQFKVLLEKQDSNTIEANLHGSMLRRVDDAVLRAIHYHSLDSKRPFNYSLIQAPVQGPFRTASKKKIRQEMANEAKRALAWLR